MKRQGPKDAESLVKWLTKNLRAFKINGKKAQLEVFAIYTDDDGRQHYHCQEPCWCGWQPEDARGK